jgi:hypothetical protein
MKLSKALKEKKRLAADIARLKKLIMDKNSYVEGSNVPEKFDVRKLYEELQQKVQDLVNLKIEINHANKEIQSSIYLLSEYKAMVSFWELMNTHEGVEEGYSYGRSENTEKKYIAQIDELEKIDKIKEFKDKIDRIQDEIDQYNYTTEIQWKEVSEETE